MTLTGRRQFKSKKTRNYRFAALLLSGTALASVSLMSGALADDIWTGGTNSAWNNASNWAAGTAPAAGDDVTIDTDVPNATLFSGITAAQGLVNIGVNGTGTLTVGGAATNLTATGLLLGFNTGAVGDLIVENNAEFDVANGGEIAASGTANVSVLTGAKLFLGGVTSIANQEGSNATVLVDGSGSLLQALGGITMGSVSGHATLTVQNGGSFEGTDLTVDGAGAVTATDANSSISMNRIFIGSDGGSGTLTVQNLATLTTGDFVIGGLAFMPPSATTGAGLFAINSGGVATTTGLATLGQIAGYTGTANIDGANSIWTVANGLVVGDQGVGLMSITNSGAVSANSVVLGQGAGSVGTLSLNSGATLTDSGGLTIGSSGSGTMIVQGGATVTSSVTSLGLNSGSTGSLLIDGMNSHMTAGLFVVGSAGVGTMTISNGGVLTGLNDGIVGYSQNTSNATNTATVTGTGSEWNLGAHDLAIGFSAASAGALTVSNGAMLSANTVVLGNNASSSGTLTVDSSATFNSAGLSIGSSGNGTMIVQGGATVTSSVTSLGLNSGSTGSLLIDGMNSHMTAGLFVVGSAGVGTMTISNGGVLTSLNDGFVGYFQNTSNATNTATVTGTGSEWNLGTHDLGIGFSAASAGALTVSNGGAVTSVTNFVIGDGGVGTLLTQTGGSVTADVLTLGNQASGTGTLTVDGAGSIFTNTGTADIGKSGIGTLTVRNGGVFNGATMIAGLHAGAQGSIAISDIGSSMTTQLLAIGFNGTGTLSLMNGATISTVATVLAVDDGSVGTATVDGVGSILTAATGIAVADAANSTGIFNITNGGEVDSITIGSIGVVGGATGTVTVDGAGSVFSLGSDLSIGGNVGFPVSGGTGTLNVTGGGNVSANNILLGEGPGGVGFLTVDGNNSFVGAAGTLGVGDVDGATGTVTVRNGGAISFGLLDIGGSSASTGTVTITDGGSSVTGSHLLVGDKGTGTLSVLNGASLSDFDADIGAGGTGTGLVDGAGSTWITRTGFDVGDQGAGLLTISNGGSFTSGDLDIGVHTGIAGTVIVAGAGSAMTGSGAVVVGDQGNGALILQDGGEFSAINGVTIAAQAGSVGVISIGAAPGSTAVGPGTLDAPMVAFGAGVGAINFNHTSDSYTFAPIIAGAGTLNQLAGVTFLPSDSSGFTGPTNITGGALHVNGSLANSAIAVSGGGTLAGNGTVGAVVAASGGIVAPGNSIGTLTVNGDYTAASGSVYQAQLDSAGHSDLLNVTGIATLANGAVLDISKTDAGGYIAGTQYKLLTAAGGVNGTYTVVGDVVQSAFAAESISYDAHDVYLNVTKVASFASAGATPNQIAVGGGADTMPTTNPLYGALASLPTFAAAQGAFDQLSGEIHASARTALIEDSRFVREAALGRLQNTNVDHPVVWGEGFGDWGSNDGNGNAAGMNRSTKGFIGGVDVPIYQTWRVGFLGGFSDTDINVKDRSSTGTSTNYHLGIYGGTESGPVAVRAGASYSWNGLQTARAVAFNGFTDRLTAQYNGGTTQAFGEVGYKVAVDAVSLEPFVNVAYVNLNTGAFNEAGGASALSVGRDATDTTFTTLGVHAKEQVDLGTSAVITAKASLGWRHAFADIAPVATNAFAGATAFSIDGVPIAQDAAAIDAGIEAAVNDHLTLDLSYTGQYASGARDNGVKANVGWKF